MNASTSVRVRVHACVRVCVRACVREREGAALCMLLPTRVRVNVSASEFVCVCVSTYALADYHVEFRVNKTTHNRSP